MPLILSKLGLWGGRCVAYEKGNAIKPVVHEHFVTQIIGLQFDLIFFFFNNRRCPGQLANTSTNSTGL